MLVIGATVGMCYKPIRLLGLQIKPDHLFLPALNMFAAPRQTIFEHLIEWDALHFEISTTEYLSAMCYVW